MRDVNVTRLDVNAIAALRSRIVETVNNTQKPGYPPDSEDIFDGVCGFVSGQLSGQVPIETDDEGLALLSYIEAVVETETGLSIQQAVLRTAARGARRTAARGARHESEKFHAQGCCGGQRRPTSPI